MMCSILYVTSAHADGGVGVGLFTPSAPFDGPVARLDFVSALAGQLGKQYTGRAYAKATDFIAAVRRSEIRYAIVDAPFVAAMGVPYTVLATCERNGAPAASWELVTSTTAKNALELRGKILAAPAVGAHEDAFVTQVLFEGELPKEHFGKILFLPDALSALAAVEHGRAEAAVIPGGLPLPAGVHKLVTLTTAVVTLTTVGWPVLVAFAPGAENEAVAAAALGFHPPQVFDRLVRAGAEGVRTLSERFAHGERRGPMAVPGLRLTAAGLLGNRTFTIPRPDLATYISVPH
jgi:hypothetical protein